MRKTTQLCLYWLLIFSLIHWPVNYVTAKERKKNISIVTDPEVSDLLKSLGTPLLKTAGMDPEGVHFYVMLNPSLNAMALPGNNIIFNSGLILAVHDRDELAAVMAHEIGHLSAGHHIKLESTMKGVALGTMVAFVAGLAASAATGNDQMAKAAIFGGTAASKAHLLGSIREKERQADRLTIGYLINTGFDPQGMIHFMSRLNREQRNSQMPPPYLLTHPLSSQRLMESQQQIDSYQTNPTIRNNAKQHPKKRHHKKEKQQQQEEDNFLLARVQATLEAGTSDDINAAIYRFHQRLETNPDHFPSRYGLAIAQRYTGQLQAASNNLEKLLKSRAKDPYLLRQRGLLRLELGHAGNAEKDFRTALAHLAHLAHEENQNNADLRYRLAFSLHEQGKLTEASRILRQLTLEHPFVAKYFYLLGITEGKQQHLGASHLSLARHFYLNRENSMARWHFREAIRQFADTEPGKLIAINELKQLNRRKKHR